MAEYIEREKLITELNSIALDLLKDNSIQCSLAAGTVVDIKDNIVAKQPTADVAEVVHGKWEKFDQECEVEYICSNCNFSIVEADPKQDCVFNYCPICGAKMDGKDGANNA